MAHAIRVDSRFATAHDTARILGMSKSRTEALIEIAKRYTDQIFKRQASEADHSMDNGHSKRKSRTTVVGVSARKSSGRDAGTKISPRKPKRIRAKR
jgi:hypothetical protein